MGGLDRFLRQPTSSPSGRGHAPRVGPGTFARLVAALARSTTQCAVNADGRRRPTFARHLRRTPPSEQGRGPRTGSTSTGSRRHCIDGPRWWRWRLSTRGGRRRRLPRREPRALRESRGELVSSRRTRVAGLRPRQTLTNLSEREPPRLIDELINPLDSEGARGWSESPARPRTGSSAGRARRARYCSATRFEGMPRRSRPWPVGGSPCSRWEEGGEEEHVEGGKSRPVGRVEDWSTPTDGQMTTRAARRTPCPSLSACAP